MQLNPARFEKEVLIPLKGLLRSAYMSNTFVCGQGSCQAEGTGVPGVCPKMSNCKLDVAFHEHNKEKLCRDRHSSAEELSKALSWKEATAVQDLRPADKDARDVGTVNVLWSGPRKDEAGCACCAAPAV